MKVKLLPFYGSKGQYIVNYETGTYYGCVNGTGCLYLGRDNKIGDFVWKNGSYTYSINKNRVHVHNNGKLIFQDTF